MDFLFYRNLQRFESESNLLAASAGHSSRCPQHPLPGERFVLLGVVGDGVAAGKILTSTAF